MGFLDKVKDFFFDEEEIEEEVVERQPEKKFNIYDIEKAKETKEEKKREKEKIKELDRLNSRIKAKQVESEINERDLFKSERTFNFPMDIDETEDDFEPVVEREKVYVREEPKEIVRPVRSEVRTEQRPVVKQNPTPTYTKPYSNTNYVSSYSPYKKETKKFKPTPVISPIYGVLNENYKKEDIVDTGKTRTMMEQKPTDFDLVRKKAYSKLDEDLEKTMNETPKDIFYNMDEAEKELEKEEVKVADTVEESVKEEYEEKPYKKDEVIISYGEVEEEATDIPIKEPEEKEEDEEDEEVPTITRTKRTKKVEVEEDFEKEESEENSDDVFKIIDNMYNDESEEEEE